MKRTTHRGHQIFSGLLACGLLASAITVSVKLGSFGERLFQQVDPSKSIVDPPPGGLGLLEQASAATADLNGPPVWESVKAGSRGPFQIPQVYVDGDVPTKVDEGSIRIDSLTGRHIPNSWFLENGMSPLEGNVQFLDADRDGFPAEDEWRYGTNPNDPNSHPPYYSKLFLKQFVSVPCRLVFKTFTGDVRKPKTWEFQVDTVDIRQPTSFLKLGDMVPNTSLKLDRYESKEVKNAKIEDVVDRSELTLINTETDEQVTLVRDQVKNVPDVFAVFDYQWQPAAGEIRVRKLQEFGLRPESSQDSLYRLMDVNESEAQIRLPDGQLRTIGHDPRRLGK